MIKIVMKNIVAAVIAFSVFNISTWAQDLQSEKQEPVRIGVSDKQGSAIGLSFMPPDEDGWNMTKTGLNVSLNKKGKSDDENSQIEAYLITLDTPVNPISSFIERIKQNTQDGYAKNSRFRIVSLEVTEDKNNPQCARLHLSLEDLKPVRTVAHEQKKFSEQYALSCGLLKNSRVGIEVRYYYRFYEPNKDSQLADKANKIFATVIIVDK